MPRKHSSSYPPELIELLVRGSQHRIVIEYPHKDAMVARHNLHRLRAAMRDEHHPRLHLVEGAVILVQKQPPALIIQPMAGDLLDAIKHSGLDLTPVMDISSVAATEALQTTNLVMDNYLRRGIGNPESRDVPINPDPNNTVEKPQ